MFWTLRPESFVLRQAMAVGEDFRRHLFTAFKLDFE
jgi:hypothetical protein